jgi:hypothetical protein
LTGSTASTPGARAIHLDLVGGIAGDMFVSALLDAFPELETRVLADVAAVIPASVGAAELERATVSSLAAKRFRLVFAAETNVLHHGHRHAAPRPAAAFDHPASLFPDMVARIRQAPLAAGTAEQAIAILTILATAEARVHGVPMDKVHFHEIADWDSLMDVVAAGSIAAALTGAVWTVSSLPRGGGLVKTQHGLLPVPAPATATILEGFEWRDDGVSGERVTPTGAAIVRHLVEDSTARRGPLGALQASGMGAGTRVLPGMPNVVRVTVFAVASRHDGDEVVVICFDVDDMTGEEIAVAADRLRAEEGVLDLTIGTRLGKKSRPVADFRILARPDRADKIVAACLVETSTIGLRWRREARAILPRTLAAEGTGLPSKSVTRPDGSRTSKIESDALKDIAGLQARRRAAGNGGSDA